MRDKLHGRGTVWLSSCFLLRILRPAVWTKLLDRPGGNWICKQTQNIECMNGVVGHYLTFWQVSFQSTTSIYLSIYLSIHTVSVLLDNYYRQDQFIPLDLGHWTCLVVLCMTCFVGVQLSDFQASSCVSHDRLHGLISWIGLVANKSVNRHRILNAWMVF